MKNKKYILGTIAALLLGMGTANADPILTLQPAVQDAMPTDVVSVDLVASALPADGIGGFDIDIMYDPGALSFVGYSVTDALGSLFFFDADDFSFGDYAAGLVNLSVVSYLATVDLVALQGAGPIILGTVEFMVDVLAPGTSTFLDISPWSIASGGIDGIPDELVGPGLELFGAEIRNPDPGAPAVPEPTTLTLFGLGLLLLRRRLVKA